MTIPVSTKNALWSGVTIDTASLHTGYPGTTGVNEVSGGSPAYARKACTLTTPSGGQRLQSAAVTFDVPSSTVRWVGYWNATTFVFAVPNGGHVPKNFMAVPSTDVIYAVGHGFSDATPVVFFNGTPPGGLTEGTIYYVRDASTDQFKVAATVGGAAIDLTTAASFGCVLSGITEEFYATQGFHRVNTGTFAIPD